MTKCIVLGEDKPKQDKLKPIEFCYIIESERQPPAVLAYEGCGPRDWFNIELVSRGERYDSMRTYDGDRNHGCDILGHWNDGVV